jgi:hypothetical protein
MTEEFDAEVFEEDKWIEKLRSGKKVRLVGGWEFWGATLVSSALAVYYLQPLVSMIIRRYLGAPSSADDVSGKSIVYGVVLAISAVMMWGLWLFSYVRFPNGSLELRFWNGRLLLLDFYDLAALALKKDDDDGFDKILFCYSSAGRREDLRWEQCSVSLWQTGITAALRDEILRRTRLTSREPLIEELPQRTWWGGRKKVGKKVTYLVWRKEGDEFELPEMPDTSEA